MLEGEAQDTLTIKWPKQPVASRPHNRRNAQQAEFAKSRVMGAAFDIRGPEQSVNSL